MKFDWWSHESPLASLTPTLTSVFWRTSTSWSSGNWLPPQGTTWPLLCLDGDYTAWVTFTIDGGRRTEIRSDAMWNDARDRSDKVTKEEVWALMFREYQDPENGELARVEQILTAVMDPVLGLDSSSPMRRIWRSAQLPWSWWTCLFLRETSGLTQHLIWALQLSMEMVGANKVLRHQQLQGMNKVIRNLYTWIIWGNLIRGHLNW